MVKIIDLFYKPKSFCREYVEIKRDSNQLMQFMATVLGIKKAYDDWFPLDKIDKIEGICKDYNLKYKFDWIFVPKKEVSNVISGGERLPTTKMMGFPFEERFKDIENASVHVFFSKSKENLELSFKNGWYPLIIKNRAIHKPYIDILRFGYFLGYPNCCINFFRKYNNHLRYNYLFEVLNNTKTKPNIYCNPLLKDHTFSYIYHMPCSYDCKNTIAYVKSFREELERLEPKLVEKTDLMLAKPLFIFKEQNAYLFNGFVEKNAINYSSFIFVGNNINETNPRFIDSLNKGDNIEIRNKDIIIHNGSKEIYKEQKESNEGFILNFAR